MAEEVDGTKDSVILEAAVLDAIILITEDKDFGELVYRQRLHHRGVMLVRAKKVGGKKGGKKGVRNLFCEAPRPARAVSPTATGKRFLTPFSPGAVHSPA